MKRTNALSVPQSTGRSPSIDTSTSREEKRRGDHLEHATSNDMPPPARTDTHDTTATRDLKKGVKAVSFLSRLMGSARKRDTTDDGTEADSNSSENRPEGNDAQLFLDSLDNLEFNPRRPQPPAYIKVRSRQKKVRDFDHLFLAQELECLARPKLERQNSSGNKLRRKISATQETNTTWAMEFSKDGRHLAAAGVDMIVRVWAVISSREDRQR
ncbi:MAG: hypothetical protein INR71_13410, partial [Terriglobus roseus]|nr:hypothetical protein [Terriglobus roseus]